MNRKYVFVAALALLASAFIGATILYSNHQGDEAKARAQAKRSHLVRAHSPTLGPANAPVVIVEFLDPACETCRAFYPFVKMLMAKNPDKIQLVLRYAPFHDGSDKVVALLEAARKQGKLWPVLESLFASQGHWVLNHKPQVDLVWKHLAGLGLDMEHLALDMTAPEIAQVIALDLADAQALNVTKTPEFFVNGKPLPSFGYDELASLVNKALKDAR